MAVNQGGGAEPHVCRSHSDQITPATSLLQSSIMGQGESREDPVTAGLLELRRAVLSGATDLARVSSLSWDQFLDYIAKLNARCRELPDSSGKYVIFAIKKGTHDNWAWKATVRICAVKMNSLSGKVESRKVMTLSEFLRLHASLETLVSDPGQTTPGTSAADVLSSVAAPMDASLIMAKIPSQEEAKSPESPRDGTCVICMERKPEAILPCTHAFCLPCIEQWNTGRKWCPVCRASLDSTSDAWMVTDGLDSLELSQYLLKATASPNPLHEPPPNIPR